MYVCGVLAILNKRQEKAPLERYLRKDLKEPKTALGKAFKQREQQLQGS